MCSIWRNCPPITEVKYIEKELGAHHSSDLFHGQQEITRATSAAFHSKVKHAETEYEKSKIALAHLEKEQEKYITSKIIPKSWSELEQKIAVAESDIEITAQYAQATKKWQANVQEAKKH